jgi:predicted nuclease of predicted toxin-antitoxin system
MRFLANENIPGSAVAALEAAGHDVVWIRSVARGAADQDVLAWAAREGRILLTFDKDFGELARRSASPRTCGVVLLRMPMPRPSDVGQRLATVIAARDDWAGHFSVIEPGRVRMRPLGKQTRSHAAGGRRAQPWLGVPASRSLQRALT